MYNIIIVFFFLYLTHPIKKIYLFFENDILKKYLIRRISVLPRERLKPTPSLRHPDEHIFHFTSNRTLPGRKSVRQCKM